MEVRDRRLDAHATLQRGDRLVALSHLGIEAREEAFRLEGGRPHVAHALQVCDGGPHVAARVAQTGLQLEDVLAQRIRLQHVVRDQFRARDVTKRVVRLRQPGAHGGRVPARPPRFLQRFDGLVRAPVLQEEHAARESRQRTLLEGRFGALGVRRQRAGGHTGECNYQPQMRVCLTAHHPSTFPALSLAGALFHDNDTTNPVRARRDSAPSRRRRHRAPGGLLHPGSASARRVAQLPSTGRQVLYRLPYLAGYQRLSPPGETRLGPAAMGFPHPSLVDLSRQHRR